MPLQKKIGPLKFKPRKTTPGAIQYGEVTKGDAKGEIRTIYLRKGKLKELGVNEDAECEVTVVFK